MRWLTLLAVTLFACSSADDTTQPATVDSATDSIVADTSVSDTFVVEETLADTASPAEASVDTLPADGWDTFAKGFFGKYCVECHAATSTTRNYATIDHVKRDLLKIKCGVATTKLTGCGTFPPPKQFPIDNATKTNPKPTDAERARLVAWLEAGTPS